MGIFKKKDKDPQPQNPTLLRPEPTTTPGGPSNNRNSEKANSYRDSTYYSSSNVSSDESRGRERVREMNRPAPGTTVTTTTTTTTTTITVAPDGTMHTSSHPYNPSADPPPESSETTLNSQDRNAALLNRVQNQNQNQNQPHTPFQNNPQQTPAQIQSRPRSTSGNRLRKNPPVSKQQSTQAPTIQNEEVMATITPRSERRSSISRADIHDVSPITPPAFPARSEARNSPGNLSGEYEHNLGYAQGKRLNGNGTGYGEVHELDTEAYYPTPLSPPPSVRPGSRSRTPNPINNTSLPSTNYTTTPSNPTPAPASSSISRKPPPKSGLTGAIRGIRGASEAIRGTVNQEIAKGMHEKDEVERMRIVKEQGMGEFRDSGLRDRIKRSRENGNANGNGVYGSEGPGGLDAVEERSVRSLESR